VREAAGPGPSAWRTKAYVVLAALAVVVLTALRVSLPADLGSWVPAALPGEAVFVLTPAGPDLLVGSAQGLQALAQDGSLRDLGVRGRVNALVREPGALLVGTDHGLVDVPEAGGPPREVALSGTQVQALSAGAGSMWAGTSAGLQRRAADGGWERSWPGPGQPEQAVPAVLAVDGGVLFAHPDGLAFQDGATGRVRLVHPGVQVVALLVEQGGTRLWAGLFGAPLLLLSEDGGRSWQQRSRGLGFSAVNVVLPDPAVLGRLLAGGSGIADGTGNAGVQTSDDRGASWQVRQGQLSNTHVFALQGRREPLRVGLRLAGLPGSTALPLPVWSGRAYAGTNGGGIYSSRPDSTLLDTLAPGVPALRLLEPFLAGLLLLVCFGPAFQRLARAGRAGRGSPVQIVHQHAHEHAHEHPHEHEERA